LCRGVLEVSVVALTHKTALRVHTLRVSWAGGRVGAFIDVTGASRPFPACFADARTGHMMTGRGVGGVTSAGARAVGAKSVPSTF
jgi:hypothetical protein